MTNFFQSIMNKREYNKVKAKLHKNFEREKKEIHKEFENLSVPNYLFLKLSETIEQTKSAAPCKHEAKDLIFDVMRESDLI